jgi:hypothetical protein
MNEIEEKIIPTKPNLEGDDVRFLRYDPETHIVVGYGHMHRDHIKREQEEGGFIIETKILNPIIGETRINPNTGDIINSFQKTKSKFIEPIEPVQSEIRQRLENSDKYFTTDALENIDEKTQANYREYRKALRLLINLAPRRKCVLLCQQILDRLHCQKFLGGTFDCS